MSIIIPVAMSRTGISHSDSGFSSRLSPKRSFRAWPTGTR